MFVHKNTRAQFAEHAAAIRAETSSEEEEEEGDILQVKLDLIFIFKISFIKIIILISIT